jgi:hypothetical protein
MVSDKTGLRGLASERDAARRRRLFRTQGYNRSTEGRREGGSALTPEGLYAEPPGPDLLQEPRHRLVARLADLDHATSALADLKSAGFRTDEVFVVSGEEGVRRLDPEGLHHGLKGRVVRAVEYLTYGERLEEEAAHLETGGVIVSLPARDAAERERAEEVLRAHDASRMRYWGHLTFEDID